MSASPGLFTKTSLNDFATLETKHKCLLINTFWPYLELGEEDYIRENYAAFFDFIGKTLQGLYPHADKFAAQELNSLLAIISTVVADSSLTRKDVIEKLREDYLNTLDADIARSVELGLRFWLGINISSKGLSVGPRNPRDTRINWSDNYSLKEIVEGQLSLGVTKASASHLQLEGSLTAVNLKSICRLNIRWTDNLVDHLRLEGQRGQRSLSVYRHKICLINHRKAPDPIIPSHILDEAIRSLDLLFPFGDAKTGEFLESENVQLHVANSLGLPRATELDDFKYWRDNLAQLLDLLNGPPETVVQTLLDTRNLPQFATLWVAIFGVFCLTILFGILGIVYTAKQYQLAIKSYELSLAVACAQLPTSLPEFCR